MATRHNRKRTRSRPRNRNGRRQQQCQYSIGSEGDLAYMELANISTSPVHSTYDTGIWNAPQSIKTNSYRLQIDAYHKQRASFDAAMMEAEHIRMFGGEVGDDAELCPKMLNVVMGLFNGNVDYFDP